MYGTIIDMNPKYIDAHAHMNFAAYDEDRDAVVKRCLDAGTWMINVGTMQATSQGVVDLANQYEEGVYAIVGLHPIHVNKSFHDTDEIGPEGKSFTSKGEEFDYAFYKKLTEHPKVVGIGECGLDYFRNGDDPEFVARQKEAFEQQIQLAIEADLPLMIHCREAYDDTLDILERYQKEAGEKVRGNMHFFAGSLDIAKRVLDLGFTLSFTGVITFAKDYEELVTFVPLDRMLSETDCPYVTPVPYRGQRNEPLHVCEVVKKIVEIKGESLETVQNQLISNIRHQFKI